MNKEFKDFEEVPGFIPMKAELLGLVKYWANEELEIQWDWFALGQSRSGYGTRYWANRRISAIADLIGEDEVNRVLDFFYGDFRLRVGETDWDMFVNGTVEQWTAMQEEMCQEMADSNSPTIRPRFEAIDLLSIKLEDRDDEAGLTRVEGRLLVSFLLELLFDIKLRHFRYGELLDQDKRAETLIARRIRSYSNILGRDFEPTLRTAFGNLKRQLGDEEWERFLEFDEELIYLATEQASAWQFGGGVRQSSS